MKKPAASFSLLFILATSLTMYAQKERLRDLGIHPGVLSPGKWNSITDVKGVLVGHTTLISGENIRTGVTAILPHGDNIFQQKVPAAIYVGNGFGKLAGITQVRELGNLETPIVLTNTLSVAAAMEAVVTHTLMQAGNEEVRSVNAVVGETNDGTLNDIRAMYIRPEHVLSAIRNATTGPVEEGNAGAGTGTVCFGFKGGIGTASRKLPQNLGAYTVGVLVQSNFGGVLQIDGIPVGRELGKHYLSESLKDTADGSCMIIVATDAPLDARNLERLAARAMLGLARTGGIATNGSGDYVIAFSTEEKLRIPHQPSEVFYESKILHNDHVSPLFLACVEATEEAILNSLVAATSMKGFRGRVVEELPWQKVMEIIRKE
jgi:D-aminopeptidase